jgi:hypothetical protein
VIDWLDIDGDILLWGEYVEQQGTHIYGYNLNDDIGFSVSTIPAWQYNPVIHESAIIFSRDDVNQDAHHFYDRDLYYLPLDDVNESQDRTSNVTVWDFMVPNVVVLDDMEFYDPFMSGRGIWLAWDNPNGTGSYVDLGLVNFAPVHEGEKSMVYSYDNINDPYWIDLYYSEIISIFDDPCDWISKDVNMITLYFYGDTENVSDRMYIALEDDDGAYAEVSYANQDDLNLMQWSRWDVTLSAFNGINLTQVKAVYIGFGIRNSLNPTGGRGYVFFDDIIIWRQLAFN